MANTIGEQDNLLDFDQNFEESDESEYSEHDEVHSTTTTVGHAGVSDLNVTGAVNASINVSSDSYLLSLAIKSDFSKSPCLTTFEDMNLRASTPVMKIYNVLGIEVKKEFETASIETPHKSKIGPRTPTPFKNALAEIGKKRDGRRYEPSSPSSLAEDLAEIIHEEQLNDSEVVKAVQTNKGIGGTNIRKNVRNSSPSIENEKLRSAQSPPPKRARKSLLSTWTANHLPNGGFTKKIQPFETETPSKFLTSPSSIMKDTLCSEQDLLFDEGRKENRPYFCRSKYKTSGLPSYDHVIDPKWARVACGKTKDQLFMEEQAYACLKNLSCVPRSLNFEKQK
uniref:C-myb C-terminal domain-containing protein n=1 Tax=Drosophila pseudoobscura pseudoobscura TaxID=46245 RepID=Q29CV6_DROPS